MSVLTRSSLEGSPLADLHVLAAELVVDGYRRLRKADLVQAILEAQPGGAPEEEEPLEEGTTDEDAPSRPRRRGGRSRTRTARDADPGDDETDAVAAGDETSDAEPEPDAGPAADAEADADAGERPARPRRSRGGRNRGGAAAEERAAREERGGRDDRGGRDGGGREGGGGRQDRGPRDEAEAEEGVSVTGVVELLGNGSGFLRVSPPEPSDDDVYISAAQVRRCELVSGDRLAGPVRAPRRSERYPSLIRIDTINDRPADEVAEGTPWDELACAFPTERFALGSEDPTLKAIEWLTPIGRGSRVTITGGPRAGKTEALKRLAGALATLDGLDVSVVYVGVRPEELRDAPEGIAPVAALGLGASPDAQGQAVERAIDTARRVAARGGHAVVLIDSLAAVPALIALRALAAARAIVDGGSLTVVATAPDVLGGETTVIALDAMLASTGRLPALDLVGSGTLRPELLVGEAGAEAIASARAEALG
jgi:transcription termination factor Rho